MFNFVSTTPDTSGCEKQLASSVKTHTLVLPSASPSVTSAPPSVTSAPKSCTSLSLNANAYSRASYQLTPGTSGCKKQLASSVKTYTSVLPSASPSVTSAPKSCTSLSLNANAYSRASYQLTPGTSGCKKQLASSVKTYTSTVDTSDNFENDEMYDSYEFLDTNDFTLSSDIPPAVSHPIKRKKTMKNVNENDSLNNARAVWSRDSSLNLIFWYKKNISNFNSPKIRNIVAWQMIVDQMENDGFFYTVNQCKRHFYELKSKYQEKNDNMSHKSSGAAPINFEFYEEFEDMFHDKPNINPKHRASHYMVLPQYYILAKMT
ncbi:hypothetical protein HCN44_010952 [Aphidius gifuensis]|uniref:Myb/SANT-like DNA-binding domain-containing protein n=1 Tax=Aphidius gifuensis TaxID=684658 RepID=A0A834Y779_APHGI|nr:hypothetical protein HCN44_010952 [Aphidius gifuensis]